MLIFNSPPIEGVVRLLRTAGLPFTDVEESGLEDFFGCGQRDSPSGIVGLELHGQCALLRSLVVAGSAQKSGCGSALVQRVEAHARQSGVDTIYLLTETAESFFRGLNYATCDRCDVPTAIQQTEEFANLCPNSAIVMMKNIADD